MCVLLLFFNQTKLRILVGDMLLYAENATCALHVYIIIIIIHVYIITIYFKILVGDMLMYAENETCAAESC